MTAEPSQEKSADDPDMPRRTFVRIGLVGTILVFVACATLVIYRSLTVYVPDAVLVVRASPAWDGTEASVDGINLAKPEVALFDKFSRYTITFHITPGEYTLTIRQGSRSVFENKFKLTRRENMGVLYLPDAPGKPTTQPFVPFSGEIGSWQ